MIAIITLWWKQCKHYPLPKFLQRKFYYYWIVKVCNNAGYSINILCSYNKNIYFTEDPIKVLKHSTDCMNSVLKMFIDIFSVAETAAMFYTNDTKVLIDIIVRQLTDLCAGNSVSTNCFDSRMDHVSSFTQAKENKNFTWNRAK